MSNIEIKNLLENHLRKSGIETCDIHIEWDPHGGLRIALISKEFENISEGKRRRLVFDCISEPIVWLIVSTPSELSQDGLQDNPLGDVKSSNIPLWPDVLARGIYHGEIEPCYPSDLENDLERPITVTFYSLRGGVGRSTALAYTAWLLSNQKKRVVCVDMDLEAPGLAALFGVNKQVDNEYGVASLLFQYDMGEVPDLSKCLLPVDDEGFLFLLPAGRPTAEYADILSHLEPDAWYREEENPLKKLFAGLRKNLPFQPDVLLVDSRTGISTLSAPLLFEQADISVIVFFPHPQAKEGTEALVNGLKASRSWREITIEGQRKELTPEPRFLASLLPSSEVGKQYKKRALNWVNEWLDIKDNDFFSAEEITHFIPYNETLATEDFVSGSDEFARPFVPVAEWAQRFVPTDIEKAMTENSARDQNKEKALEELSFDTDTAERQDKQVFLNSFLKTGIIKRALRPDVPLVLGRKGTGKTSVFRALITKEFQNEKKVEPIIVNPASKVGFKEWHLSSDGFAAIDKELVKSDKMDWKQFWLAYIVINLILQGNFSNIDEIIPETLSGMNLTDITQESFIEKLDFLSKETTRIGLYFGEVLQAIDKRVNKQHHLLFDGLDVGFGSGDKDRKRRKDSLVGLFTLLTEWEGRLNNLNFKVMLREDIWRKLKFENKTHLYGRSVVLKWSDQLQYLKVIIKQAFGSPAFQETVKIATKGDDNMKNIPLERWSDSDVSAAWNALAGERMAGGKTAFTKNWVWARLGDANGDHAPRHLNLLFDFVLKWERDQQKKNPYERSLIRPKALIENLPEVSERAIASLIDEEFKELETLKEKMREIGGTPFSANKLKDISREDIDLAREVGLIKIHEGTEGDVTRYSVPELYRWGLNMGRKGPV